MLIPSSCLLRRIVLRKPNGIRGDEEQTSDRDQHTEDEQREARVTPHGFAVLMGRKHHDRPSETAENCTRDHPLQHGRLALCLRHGWHFLSWLHWDLARHLCGQWPIHNFHRTLMAAKATTRDDSSRSRVTTTWSTAHRAVMDTKPDHWIGNVMKEKKVKRALRLVLPPDYDRFDELFDLAGPGSSGSVSSRGRQRQSEREMMSGESHFV
jgi:hypothetical protein